MFGRHHHITKESYSMLPDILSLQQLVLYVPSSGKRDVDNEYPGNNARFDRSSFIVSGTEKPSL